MGRQKGTSLTAKFDQKILRLISLLLEEKTQEKIRLNGMQEDGEAGVSEGSSNDPFANAALVRDVTVSEATRYVISRDLSLARTKRAVIEKLVDRVLIELRAEEAEEMGPLLDGFKKDNAEDVLSQKGESEIKEESKTEDAESGIEEVKNNSKKRSKDSGGSKPNKRQNKEKDRTPPNASLAQLGGIDDVVSQLMELVGMPILHPEIYAATGVEPPRGVLLHGPPGCGKTTLANALAGDLKVPFIAVSAPLIVSGMSGESEKKVRELFQEAKSLAPCLMFMDEIDAITPKRDGAQREMEKRIVAQLLTCIDELSVEKNNGKPVIIIGATNRPDSLDPALRRAGRFDREICLNVPSEASRVHILKAMTSKLKIHGELDFVTLAKRTPGYVGADLKALATAAGICAIKRIFTTLSDSLVGDTKGLHNDELDETSQKIEIVDDESNENTQTSETVNDDAMEIDMDENSNNLETIQQNNNSKTIQQNNNSKTIQQNTNLKTIQQNTNLKTIANSNISLLQEEEFSKLSTIQKFLRLHPDSLTPEQLEPLSITFEDFLAALPTIQPTAKREGFATIPDVSWSNVGALSNIRVELHMAVVQPIKRPELYEKFGITVPGGVLLWGPPGCGKTLLAKAVANESRANFISIKGPELLNKYVGESEKAVRQVFARARASVPCIIFFDELDALVPKRDTTLSESSSRVVNTLLTELDGLNDRKGIFVIGATNRPDMIDPAMLRPGRLDKTLYVELPTRDERLEILKTIIRSNNTPLHESVDLEAVATDGRISYFSGADLAALVREAGVFALRKKFYTNIGHLDEKVTPQDSDNDTANVVTAEDFENALAKVKASVSAEELEKYHNISRKMDGVTDLE